jgi:hypothetical protein
MSLLTPPRVPRRRNAEPPSGGTHPDPQPGWHVGLSLPGMFPQHEVGCPCAKAPCGLAIPRSDAPCSTHPGRDGYQQAHAPNDCSPRKWFRRPESAGK